jgi:hypothetical protein
MESGSPEHGGKVPGLAFITGWKYPMHTSKTNRYNAYLFTMAFRN